MKNYSQATQIKKKVTEKHRVPSEASKKNFKPFCANIIYNVFCSPRALDRTQPSPRSINGFAETRLMKSINQSIFLSHATREASTRMQTEWHPLIPQRINEEEDLITAPKRAALLHACKAGLLSLLALAIPTISRRSNLIINSGSGGARVARQFSTRN